MLFDDLFYFRKLGVGKSMIDGQGNRPKPKLGLKVVTSHVNVGWLMVFAAVKMKSIWADTHHRWHECRPYIRPFKTANKKPKSRNCGQPLALVSLTYGNYSLFVKFWRVFAA
jgi:hypothetical protein